MAQKSVSMIKAEHSHSHSQSHLNVSLLSQSRNNHQQSYRNLSSKVLPQFETSKYSKDQMNSIGQGKSIFGGALYLENDSTQSLTINQSLNKQQSRLAGITRINSLRGGFQLQQLLNTNLNSPVQYKEPLNSCPIMDVDPNSFVKIQKFTTVFKTFSHKGTDTTDDGQKMLGLFSIERDQKEYELKMLMQQTENNILTLNQAIQNKFEFESKNSTEVANRLREMAKKMNKNYQDTEIYLMEQIRTQGLQQDHEGNEYSTIQKDLQFQVSLVQKSTAQRIFRLASTKLINSQQKNVKQVVIAHDKKKKYNKVEVLETMLNKKQQEFEKKAYEFQDLCQKFDSHDTKLQNLLQEMESYKNQVNDMEAQKSMEQELKIRQRRNEQATQVYIIDPVLNNVTQQLQIIMVENGFLKEEMKRHAVEAQEQKSKMLQPKNMEETFLLILNSEMSPQEMIQAFQELLHISYQSQTTIKMKSNDGKKRSMQPSKTNSEQEQFDDDIYVKKKFETQKKTQKKNSTNDDSNKSVNQVEDNVEKDLDVVGELADEDGQNNRKSKGNKKSNNNQAKNIKERNNSVRININQPIARKSRYYDSLDLSDDNLQADKLLSKEHKSQSPQKLKSKKTIKADDSLKLQPLDKNTQTKYVRILDDDDDDDSDDQDEQNLSSNENKKRKAKSKSKSKSKSNKKKKNVNNDSFQEDNSISDIKKSKNLRASQTKQSKGNQDINYDSSMESKSKDHKQSKSKNKSKKGSESGSKSLQKDKTRKSVDHSKLLIPSHLKQINGKSQNMDSSRRKQKITESLDSIRKTKRSDVQIPYENTSVDEVLSDEESSPRKKNSLKGNRKIFRRKNHNENSDDDDNVSENEQENQDQDDEQDEFDDEEDDNSEEEQEYSGDSGLQNKYDQSDAGSSNNQRRKKNKIQQFTQRLGQVQRSDRNPMQNSKLQRRSKKQDEIIENQVKLDGQLKNVQTAIKRSKFSEQSISENKDDNKIQGSTQKIDAVNANHQLQQQIHRSSIQKLQTQESNVNEQSEQERMRQLDHERNSINGQIEQTKGNQDDEFQNQDNTKTMPNNDKHDNKMRNNGKEYQITEQSCKMIKDDIKHTMSNKNILSNQQNNSKLETLSDLMTQLTEKNRKQLILLGSKAKSLQKQFLNHDCINYKPCGEECVHLSRFLKLIGFQNYVEKRKQLKLSMQDPLPFPK